MELHELPTEKYEDLPPEGQKAADDATHKAMRIGEIIFTAGKSMDSRPPVVSTALVYAIMRLAAEAGVTKEGARKLIGYTVNRLQIAAEPGGPIDSMWADSNPDSGK